MEGYDHKKIEKKWREKWAKSSIYKTSDSVKGKDNHYLLVEFPYPSGNLHVGHWYAFAIPDILARYQRMRGKNVLFPIGFDAFGLPAENAAIKRGLDPAKWTRGNIAHMKEQMRSMGASFDWSREVATCDPEYYKWTQWQFLQLFKKGLVYRKETAVNWCPKDKTVLANEQVVDGKCERCDSPVEQKMMLQWNIRITEYADRLVEDLKELDWPEQIKESQRNWIGRSEGAEIDFALAFEKGERPKPNFLIIHGYHGTAKGIFLPWLKERLENSGFTVQVPDLPDPEHPNESEQVQYVLDTCLIDEQTIVVGHSLGSVVAAKVVERAGKEVAGLVLIAAAMDPSFPGAKKREYWGRFEWNFDYEKLKTLAGFRTLLSDTQESTRKEYLRQFSDKLKANLVEVRAKKEHFTDLEEPSILAQLLPHVTVFTTRPDTLFGATYLVVAPEHPLVERACEDKVCANRTEVEEYVAIAKRKTELERLAEQKEKTGVRLKGVEAINPATGEKIPVYIADYVLATYGTGAIMAVPAHDQRDYEFAKKFGLPVTCVIEPKFIRTLGDGAVREGLEFVKRNAVAAVVRNPENDTYLCISWKGILMHGLVTGGIEDGEDAVEAARREVREETGYKNLRLMESPEIVIHSLFYHRQKNCNRWARFQYVFFELENDERDPMSEEETARHEVLWKQKSDLRNFFTVVEGEYVLNLLNKEADTFTGEGIVANSGEYNGLESLEARKMIAEKFGRTKTTFKLRDWIVSRQRYWGVPIPIIHCPSCGEVPVPDKDLPVKLPLVKDYLPDGSGRSPLAKAGKWVRAKCPVCGKMGERETDTLDTFVDSSWYFLRYTDPKNKRRFADAKKMAKWMPVDMYSGGAEHTTMHLLYSRFWHKALFDLGLVADKEPYARRMNRSLIMGPDGQKMSKSRGNVIDPDEVVERLGADTVRMYLAFIGPYNEVSSYPWNPNGVVGVRRFIERVFRLQQHVEKNDVSELDPVLHKTIKKVGEDIEALKFNTAIAQLMTLLNEIEKHGRIGKGQWEVFLRLLAPFAPFVTQELWSASGWKSELIKAAWPSYRDDFLREETAVIAIQVGGKTRGQIRVPADSEKEEVIASAKDAVQERLAEKTVVKVIYVPGRLVNFVLSE